MPGSGPKFGEFTWWRKGGGSGCVVVVIAMVIGVVTLGYTTVQVVAAIA